MISLEVTIGSELFSTPLNIPSTLAWKITWMEEPGRLRSMGSLRVGHDWVTSLSLLCIGEGNGNPLQCSCLENPRDGGAWWAAVYGVAQSRTRLKWLSSSSSKYPQTIIIPTFSSKNDYPHHFSLLHLALLITSPQIPIFNLDYNRIE